jgi:AraC-like DNA-binding protein
MNHYREAVIRATDQIERQLRDPISLDEIARRAGFSLWHFNRIFAKLTGESLGSYACFTHRGPVAKLGETINYAFSSWLPRSKFMHSGGPNIDRQDERFRDGGKDCELDFLVPVKAK